MNKNNMIVASLTVSALLLTIFYLHSLLSRDIIITAVTENTACNRYGCMSLPMLDSSSLNYALSNADTKEMQKSIIASGRSIVGGEQNVSASSKAAFREAGKNKVERVVR